MKRREFLAGTAGAALALGAPALGRAKPKPPSALRITILHTNDMHSHLEPREGGEHKGLGGAAIRSAFIARVRAEHPRVLLLDSGDIIQGTAYFNLYRGEPEMQAMSAQGYLAAAVGNHDFDAGIERLAELAKTKMNFPFLCANYDFTGTPMQGLARESMILEFEGARVGIFGLGIKLEGLVSGRLTGGTQYYNPLEAARRVARRLRGDEKCDMVLCLSHASENGAAGADGTREPGDEAIIREVPEIDFILGGHNHFLYKEVKQFERAGGVGYVNQVGWAGTHMGFAQFDLYAPGKRELAMGGAAALG